MIRFRNVRLKAAYTMLLPRLDFRHCVPRSIIAGQLARVARPGRPADGYVGGD